ncbi:MAG: choice-of-anchor Q domain-containing protein, partial [Bacteroidota bacterium]
MSNSALEVKRWAFAGLLLVVFAQFSAQAQLVVTNNNASGAGSLQEAILNAADGETIYFDRSLNGASISNFFVNQNTNKTITIDAYNLSNSITLIGSGASYVLGVNAGTMILKNIAISAPNASASTIGDIGGISLTGNLEMYDCELVNIGNEAPDDGPTLAGGIWVEDGSSLIVRNSAFINIHGSSTAVIYNAGNVNLGNVTIHDFDTDTDGAGQAIFIEDIVGSGIFNHVTIFTGTGKAINNDFAGGPFQLNFCLIDETFDTGGENLLQGDFEGDRNYIGDTPSGWTLAGSGNLQFDQQDDFPASISNIGGLTPVCPISAGHPAIDLATGSSSQVDARGYRRTGVPDAGAHESSSSLPTIFYVDVSAADGGEGTTWGSPYSTLQEALIRSNNLTQIWVAAGNYI